MGNAAEEVAESSGCREMRCRPLRCRASLVPAVGVNAGQTTTIVRELLEELKGMGMCFSVKMFLRQGCWEEPQGNREQTEQAANCKEQKYIGKIKESVCIVWNPPGHPRFASSCLAKSSFQPLRRSWLVWNQTKLASEGEQAGRKA